MRSFFDEWPKARESWSDLEVDRSSNKNAFSSTQLSMSIPMAPSDYSSRDACSPDGEFESFSTRVGLTKGWKVIENNTNFYKLEKEMSYLVRCSLSFPYFAWKIFLTWPKEI